MFQVYSFLENLSLHATKTIACETPISPYTHLQQLFLEERNPHTLFVLN